MSKRQRCDQVFVLAVIISAAILCAPQPAEATKLETQIKLLINDDELLLQPQHQQQQRQLQHRLQQQQQPQVHQPTTDNADEAHYNLYRSELKRLSYETIHRILRDENEPVYRREDAELRYYQKRSYQPRHELVRRSTAGQTEPYLNLSHNALRVYNGAQQFQSDASYAAIKTIDLSDNQLVEIKNLERFTHLQTLDLHGNALAALTLDGICHATGNDVPLTTLNLNGNRIQNGTAPPCAQLRQLHLSGNAIKSLNALNLSALAALETLDLSGNELRNLETAFFPQRMHNLKHLNLANNQLGSIYRETFYNLLSLNTLLLRGNNITDIDYETFLALPNLQYLDLSHNQLHGTAIRALQGIPDLMGLSIAYNPQVGAAMQEFVASWSLKELDASGTGLCQIPAALAQSVRTLKLTDNWLKVINCGDLDSYPLLQYLDLSHSRIEDIEDDALGRLEILETLFLDHNRLHRVPLSLPTSLSQLFLQDNQIMEIQVQAFQGLNNLQTLDLSGNKLLYLPALPLPKLLTLNVQAAELKGVSQAIVHTLPRLRDLLLEDNPIKCSDLMGLAEWASACRIVDDAIEIPNALDGSSGAQTVAVGVAVADADVGQQTKGAKIDLKQQYVQMHNFYEKFKSNCGLTRQITMTSATATAPTPLPPPTCVAKPDTTMMTVAAAMPTRSSRGATFVANENTEMPNEKLTGLISLPSEKTQQATPLLPTSSAMLAQSRAAEVATASSESMSKVTSSVATISSAETTKPTAATKERPLNNNKNMPNTWTSGSLSHKTQTKQKANMTMSNNTNSFQTAQTLRPTETTTSTTTTVTTLLAKHANQMNQQQQQQQQHEQQMPRMPTEATAKHANHVAIANETISLQTAKRQTTTTTATSTATQTPTAMATAINSGRQTQLTTTTAGAAAAVESTMPMGVTESALNNGSSLAQPVTISAVATPTTTTTTITTTTAVETKVEAATTTVAATKVPQTILTAIKSGRQQQQQQQEQQRHSDDETRSLLNQNNIVANAIITNRVAGIEFVDNNDSNNNNNRRASLSDTSGQPTITKMETAPKTNAKMSTQQQQRTTLPTQPTSQSQSLSLLPPHKHEPLQLHIKDRHLIGTPLLMHKGENVLVDAEQLLLPGTATVAGNAHTHVAAVADAVAANDASLQTPSLTTTTTTTATATTTTNYNNNKKQASGKGNAAGADILAQSQFDKQTTVRLKQHSGQPEAINVQTNTHYSDTKLAVDKSDNEAQQHKHKVLKDREVKFNSKKMKPSLSMKKMTYSTKHAATTPKTTTSASSTDSAEDVEPLLLHMKQQQQQQQHNSVNTPNAANIEHELNTFAQLQASAQLDQAQASLPLRHTHASDLSKSEQWLDTRPAATHTGHSHPGVVLLLSVGLVILLLVGLMHVYRCDMPWRRHAHGVRPHRRQFNDDDAHSFLHYQGGSGSVSGSGGGSSNHLPIQKWHHSTRREAPYSSPLHNLHVRELQKSATGAQSQDKAQLRQHFYSATLNANAAGGTSSSSSSASSSASSSCGLNRSPASSIMADESFYIEMTPDVGAQQHACDLLPMELLAGSSVSNSQDELTRQTTTTTMCANGDQRDFEYQTRKTMSNKLAPSTRRLGIW